MKLYRFRTKNFKTVVTTMDEPFEHDKYMDPDLVRECREKINSGEWKCFFVTVEVTHRPTDEVLATTYLSQCIYADRKDFVDHRGMNARGHGSYFSYFSQMVKEACRSARKEMLRKRGKINDGLVKECINGN